MDLFNQNNVIPFLGLINWFKNIMSIKKHFSDFIFTEKRGFAIENAVSMSSQIIHFTTFELKRPKNRLNNAMLIFSIDVDAGSRKLGLVNAGKNDANVHACFTESYIGDIESRALPVFMKTFTDFEMPATFAVRGQVADDAYEIMELLLNSPVKHDIGAHGYSHRSFSALSKRDAEEELHKIAVGFKRFGITPKSFVFPRNMISHLDLLEKFGYKCYREKSSGILNDGMYIEKKGNLYNIQPSLYLNLTITPIILKSILQMAIVKRAPMHIWFHPWTFGKSDETLRKYVKSVFTPFLKQAYYSMKKGMLTFETMSSAAEKAELI